jgi:hypothetical protein
MNFFGIIRKYPINRRLTDAEISHQLRQNQRQNVDPHYQLSVIEMNSTYLETVDKWFAWKGYLTAVILTALLTVVLGIGFVAFEAFLMGIQGTGMAAKNPNSFVWSGVGMFVLFFVPAVAICVWLLRKDSFTFTHYPIRFNRKDRMVHVFRTNGTILSAPWDQIFFTLGHMGQWNEWEVRGHVLDVDRVTVKETFALSFVDSIPAPPGGADQWRGTKEDSVSAHWEFVRRYMEDGPQAVSDQIQFCMPVASKKESAKGSFERMFANMSGAPIIAFIVMCPFLLLFSVGRLIAMRTSKIPVWPREILASSPIPDEDPYAIMGNHRGERTSVFPGAAQAAGVCFKESKAGN